MNRFDGQTLAAVICVLVAGGVLIRRTVMWWRGQATRGHCGGCGGGCSAPNGPESPRLKVSLPVLRDSKSEQTR